MGTIVPSTELIAPAKLTLSLRITDVRADGYHLIDAEMVSLDIADVLRITPAETTSISVSGPYGAGVPTDSSNLVAKALELAGRNAHVEITKNIPNGGGLGGGSSDAAAVMRWAGLSDLNVAVRVGADVPYCLVGARSRVRGIGEIVEPLSAAPEPITLIVLPVHCPTPLVYKQWDEMGGPRGEHENDLEPAACVAVPELAMWRERIVATGHMPTLAGSGSTWFVRGHHPEIAPALPGAQVHLATTLN